MQSQHLVDMAKAPNNMHIAQLVIFFKRQSHVCLKLFFNVTYVKKKYTKYIFVHFKSCVILIRVGRSRR
jgi:hypothetical protein